ncbi:3-methyladenine DNA glycosylase [Bordetella trematum]|uniref:DNA-3-methyladenine glycosylase n=1 Tax=Bordetella trematum TaxID=123899 RepID=A0A157QU46_9BORD|nr:DNA-3-methyladenine glycosylase I [Bordetella trematum]AUL48310.1 3-methyladenine DNA glycosylase [Bordetella trematum]AZR95271.1 3-methyladenine DNA glycosylase [Bordetella trematum]NNH18184.1 DNA-3-methyladenine glycosylase I [Bordetella trematum]SAI49353.1 DNA-3-methyladenine glycosylase [Bordetella trematum]SAI66909.1 DNA-3-methyladenine glycosylase [Bordetella trematum]
MPLREDFPDGQPRCGWLDSSDSYREYHDLEWGHPSVDERHLFEQLCLEGMQAGLSWRTILNKREGYRQAFAGFDIEALAAFGPDDVERLLRDPGIVRHRGKIEAIIHNAACARRLRAEQGSLAAFFWRHAAAPAAMGDGRPTPEAVALSKALKKLGWKFVGPTTVHAFMQATGMINDHHPGCCRRTACSQARRALRLPGR